MKRLSQFIVNHVRLILIIGILLLIPAIYGYFNTRINYDLLVYLPDSVETIKAEKELTDDFKLGSFAFVMEKNKTPNEMLDFENKVKNIKGVNEVVSVYDLLDSGIPDSFLPDKINDILYEADTTILFVTFNGGTSDDETIAALKQLRRITYKENISSMTAMVLDTSELSNSEMALYVIIAVVLCIIVLVFATDSYLVPPLLLLNIGIAIVYNFGSNIFLGNICYITKAIAAILQLGVTTDFSIFLYHKYQICKKTSSDNKEAMRLAISETFTSVIGSSLTTFAGFLALCTMTLTLGVDIGIVMAKGVLCGLVTVFTIFPALLLVFDKQTTKFSHKNFFPRFERLQRFSLNHRKLILILFVLLMIPAFIGNSNYKVYYKLDDSLPKDLPFNVANERLKKDFNIVSPSMILIDNNLPQNEVKNLTNDLKKVKGIDLVLAPKEVLDNGMISVMPSSIKSLINNDKYSLIVLNSTYEIASFKLNNQITEINKIVNKYDKKAIVAGEGALMKDLVTIADHDFKVVNYTSLIVILIIMIFVLRSFTLPVILAITIEFAIFLNMACAYFTGTNLPFIASIVVGTIQLGATIDYAILMSTKYVEERKKTKDVSAAMKSTLDEVTVSIITSALCFLSATIGVGLYTKIDMIGSICILLARGSIISMLVVILILPSLLMTFDKLIIKKGGRYEKIK